ncbi:MAG: hypothetical protein GC138_01525 [Gammaproteobacteria bacterium]|nr:hypothetical protein [Gammaproteobacteria bacterium]
MARDYKRSARSARRSQRRGQKRKRIKASTKAALWLAAGLTIGLSLGLAGWYIAAHRTGPGNKAAVTAPAKEPAGKKAEKTVDTAPSKAKADDPWHFDFYRLLPKMEVVVSDEELAAGQSELEKEKPHGPYILQVGSFRRYSDADALKARLALLGIQAGIEAIVVDNGNTWNRVRVGPFADMKALKPVRRQLEREQIAFIMIELDSGK